ncbi:hypothetical protein DV714_05810 [Parageobacillus thermoglucosidasius]|nr:hypothetical protein DV714_05810 [Parageobacillus thermoglucosidasius]
MSNLEKLLISSKVAVDGVQRDGLLTIQIPVTDGCTLQDGYAFVPAYLEIHAHLSKVNLT